MSETVVEGRSGPSRTAKVATIVALLAAVVYTVLFSAGWRFLFAAAVIIAVLYVATPYLASLLRE